jgi:hypothetical protein
VVRTTRPRRRRRPVEAPARSQVLLLASGLSTKQIAKAGRQREDRETHRQHVADKCLTRYAIRQGLVTLEQ